VIHAISPSFSSVLMASAGYSALPFYLAGGLKIVYDLLMYREPECPPAGGAGLADRLVSDGSRRRRH
jgi:hypothetical protein